MRADSRSDEVEATTGIEPVYAVLQTALNRPAAYYAPRRGIGPVLHPTLRHSARKGHERVNVPGRTAP